MYYPIYLDLRGKSCLIVGGGKIATEKTARLIESGARVIVVSPEASEHITKWQAEGRLEWHRRDFKPSDVENAFLVISATDDALLNATVFKIADALHRVANAVDDLEHCNFIAPAIARTGTIQVAVSTSGNSPALAKQLRDKIQIEILDENVARLNNFLGAWRPEVKQKIQTYQARQIFWESVLASEVPNLIEQDDIEGANKQIGHLLSQSVW
jgi:siroheme synthase-like protein